MKKKSKKQKKPLRSVGNLMAVCLASALLVTLIVGIVATIHKNLTASEDALKEYYDAKCQSFAVQNANLAKGQIVFIGDSITDLYVLDEGYSDLTLAAYNRGIGGDTTSGVLRRLQVSVFDIEPAYVVLMIGTNDIIGGVPEDEILANYAEILDQIRAALPNTKIFCMSIIPMNQQMGDFDVVALTETICRVNERIYRLAWEKGAVYLDLFELLADEEKLLRAEYTDDGLHLNQEGLLVWTKLLKPYLLKEIIH